MKAKRDDQNNSGEKRRFVTAVIEILVSFSWHELSSC